MNIAIFSYMHYKSVICCAAKMAQIVLENTRRNEQYVLEHLREAFGGLPQVEASEPVVERLDSGSQYRIDAEMRLDVGGRNIVLLIEVKKSVYPRDVRQILWQLDRYVHREGVEHGASSIPFLAAESISQGARELLRHENVGYYDTGGSLYVPAPGAYIFVEKPPPKTLEKSVRSLFKGKRAQIVHTLLVKRGEWFGATALAEIAEVAPSTASETLISLERYDWLESRGQGPAKERRLIAPTALLDEWSKQVQATRLRGERRYYVPRGEPDTIIRRLAAACREHEVSYVITREAAAQRYSPFLSALSQVACRMKPGSAAEEALAELGARSVGEGANLNVIETPTSGEFLFKERVDDAWLASPVQVYLDLLTGEGRSREMAAHLRHERIGF